MTTELHIASLVVRIDPARMAEVLPRLNALPQIEVALLDPSGKLVLMMETTDEAAIAETLTRLQLMDGVASAALVYHHNLEPDEAEQTEGTAR
ncbi:MAG: chaperone NapD [Gemmobacter sp.]|jgi:nitrate reductase NapD